MAGNAQIDDSITERDLASGPERMNGVAGPLWPLTPPCRAPDAAPRPAPAATGLQISCDYDVAV